MSTLLDILHRKDGRPDADAPDAQESPVEAILESDAPPIELRLAVDNGPPNSRAELSIPAAADGFDTVVGYAPGTAADPLATFGRPAASPAAPVDGAGNLTAEKLRQRSRRSTVLLGAGLALIIMAAGAATWLLNEIKAETSGDGSLFVTPGAGTVAMPEVNSGAIVRPAPAADVVEATASPPVAPPRAAKTPAIEAEYQDTAWFDAAAVEDSPAAPGTITVEPIRIVRGTTTNPLFPKLTEAWTAFQAADYARAEVLYREVRAADASNVDALLGLGAIAARGNRGDEARDLYQAALLADPANAAANSALSTLPATGTRNLDESALKSLLREQPGAANLHFALGLQYVARDRWPDAQSAFFEAVKNEPTNADYAYNLAVSLDRLRQSGPAAAYYQRALDLATASALFNADAARERLATLRNTVR